MDQYQSFQESHSRLLPILLGSGSPQTALQQLIDFSEAYALEHSVPFDFKASSVPELLHVFGRSDYLSRRLIRNPKGVLDFCSGKKWKTVKTSQMMLEELRAELKRFHPETIEDLKNVLRLWKYREFLRISIRDLCFEEVFVETLEEWTSVAESLLQVALEEIHNLIQKKERTRFSETPFMILGMGKLGGSELNHSSDVDLIFIHDDLSPPEHYENSNRHRLSVARTLIDVMSDLTEDGFLARVDLRLRPGGDRAPLVQSLDEVELYYSAKGELWERQALIKGRGVAGCKRTRSSFRSMITPFIYSRLMDERLSREIQHMKGRIEEEHLRENQLNVKLGVGGIREIEFFVQTFQLLYGGGRKNLRQTNTLKALEAIQDTGLIPELDGLNLKRAYIFLRRVEHRLQMREEQQTHTIPIHTEPQRNLARCMGYDDLNPENQNGTASASGNVFYHVNDERAVIWFDDVVRWTGEAGSGTYDFQFVLYPNGRFKCNYRQMEGSLDQATIGWQNSSGSQGTELGTVGEGFVFDNFSWEAKTFSGDDIPWLSLSSENGSASGSLVSGDAMEIFAQVNTTDLQEGSYSANISIASPDVDPQGLQLNLTVNGDNSAPALPFIDISGSENGIVDIPEDIDPIFSLVADKYTHILTPSGDVIPFITEVLTQADEPKFPLLVSLISPSLGPYRSPGPGP